jgi:alpha-glucosidase
MAICVDDGQQWGKHGLSKNAVYRTVNDSISFVVPRKYKRVSNSYNEIILRYPNYDIEFRAYNDGLAYRFCGNQKKVKSIEKEVNCYQFPADYIAYTLPVGKLQNWFEENYCVRPLSEQACDSFSIIPVMVKTEGVNVVLAEANVHNYPNLYLRPNGHGFDNLQAAYPKVEEVVEGGNKIYVMEREDYLVRTNLNRSFPWRVTGLFDNDVDILNSELIYLLSDQTSSDFSWVKPGQVLWDWWNHNNIVGVDFKAGINTPTYLSMIDFAARNGVPYVLIDEGWSAYDSLLKLNPEVDMPEICAYAKAKGVGIMLWAKWVNVEKSLDEAFELMHQWDVKGVKIDFMDRNDAKMNDFYERVLEKAATYGLMIDLHGSYPNSGLRAKYPNLMTREGVLGMEYDKWSNRATVEHDLMIPYLRMWVGPMDYTPGAMLNANQDVFVYNAIEPMSQGTRVHQMAMYVVYESPLQMLSDSQTNYANNQECFDFIKQIPVVWDYTQGLAGSIGHDIAIARRSGNKWYVGVMAGFKTQLSSIDLSFLPIGRYRMTSFADGVNVEQNAKDYCKEVQEVESGNILDIHLAQGGGFVACFEPIGN